jgi:hypothetical protein
MANTRLARRRRQMFLHEKRKRGRMSNYDSIQTINSTGDISRKDGTINISENEDIPSKLLNYNYLLKEY